MNSLQKPFLVSLIFLLFFTSCNRLSDKLKSILPKKEPISESKQDIPKSNKPKVKGESQSSNSDMKSTPYGLEQAIKDQAAFEAAQKDKNSSKCQSIVNLELKNLCTKQVLLNQAISNQDTKYCEELTQDQDKAECYKLVGK